MPVSKSQQKAVHKYVKANYDRMELTVPKGRKDMIKAHAETQGESVNGFINRAIENQIFQDRRQGALEGVGDPFEVEKVYLPSEQEEARETAQNSVTAKED